MHIPIRWTALACAGLAAMTFACDFAGKPRADRQSQSEALPGGWVRHRSPTGIAVDLPPGWNLNMDSRSGRMSASGPEGQQVHFWPGFIQGRSLTPASAQAVLAELAPQFDPSLAWGRPGVQGTMARMEARTPRCKGVALLSWRPSEGGTALLAQAVEAPPALYQSSLETFGRILGSFRYEPQAVPQGQAESSRPRQLSFVRWNDPREAAFSVDVPQGWEVAGGLYRLSATDVRSSLRVVSPDRRSFVFLNDARLGAFMQPSQMLANYGFREGSVYPLSDGSRLQVRRYQAGQAFASEYARTLLQKDFPNIQLGSSANRPDLASAYQQEVMAESSGQYSNVSFSVTAGDASFTCNAKGTGAEGAWKGYVRAGTVVTNTPQSSIWYVHRVGGYVASPASQAEAEQVFDRLARTFATSPAWLQKQRQIAAQAVHQDNVRSQQLRSQVLAKIARDQRETSDLIVSSYNRRSQVMDEISRKRSNATLGTVDVVDPRTRDRYKVSYDSDVHWISDTGRIAGTSAGTHPGVGWTQMLTLP